MKLLHTAYTEGPEETSNYLILDDAKGAEIGSHVYPHYGEKIETFELKAFAQDYVGILSANYADEGVIKEVRRVRDEWGSKQ